MSDKTTDKKVKIFALASFLHDMGSDIVFSLWPIFVTQVLGANMAILGFIDGLGDAIVSISQAVSGYISDKIRKRKLFVWLGYLFGGAARIGYAIAPTWQWLVPFRLLDRSGKMRGSPRDAIISDLSKKENRGRNFGLLRTMDNLGAIVGILIAIFFLGTIGYKNLFLLAAIPSLIAVALIIIFVKENKPVDSKIYKGIRFAHFNKDLKLYTILSTIFALGSFSYSFLLVFAKQSGLKIGFVPVMYLLFTVIASIFSLPFGRLSDRVGRKKVLLASFIFWTLVCIIFILRNDYLGVITGFILYGLHRASIEPVQKAYVAELAPKDYLASTIGGFQMLVGLVTLPGSLIAGILWDRLGMTAPFYFSLILTLVTVGLLSLIGEIEPE